MKLHIPILFFLISGVHTPLAANPMWEEMFAEQLDEAEAGDIDARYEVGVMYLKGQGIQQDRDKALMWLRRAADEGHTVAARKISRMQEQQVKFEQLSAAARAGSVQAQYEVAMMYLKGRGVARSGTLARKWLAKSADQGDPKASARLGILNYKGEGGEQDYAMALKLFKQVEEKSALAQYYLGDMYASGSGVKQDRQAAIEWYRKSAQAGFDHAHGKIINLEEEIKMAERRRLNSSSPAPVGVKQAKKSKPGNKVATAPAVSKKPAKKKVVARKVPPSPLKKIADGRWLRGSSPVNYLPSTVTRCEREKQKLVCLSEVLERTSGTQIVQYRVKSVVVSENNAYVISYRNLVLDVTETVSDNDQPLGYDDEVEYGYKIQTGWTQAHKVNCDRLSGSNLSCVKDKTHKITLVAGR